MHALEDSIISFLVNLFAAAGYGGIALAMAIESACIPLPSELIMPLAGFNVAENHFSFVGVTLAGTIGGTIGSIIAYLVGMAGGRPLLMRYGRFVLISPHDLAMADRWFARYGDGTAFFSRLLPVVRTFISLPAGIARMPFLKFVIYTFAGSLIWTGILAYAGVQLGTHWQLVRATMQRFDYLFIGIIVVLIAMYIYRHVRYGRRPAHE